MTRRFRLAVLSLPLLLAAGLLAPPASATTGAEPAYSLTPNPCPIPALKGWECSTLDVPMNWWARDNGDRAQIAVAVRRATGETRGTLTLHPGGPGISSLLNAELVLGTLPATILRHFDLVLWDQRGVGLSRPLPAGCTVPVTAPEIPDTGAVDWDAIATSYFAASAEGNRQCYDANRDIAPYLGTQYVVRDLEALRKALGVHRWSYWGMSYGTQVGLLYARLYPTRLRAIVLDGSVQPGMTILSAAASRGTSYQAALALLGASIGKVHSARMYRVIDALNRRTYVDDEGFTVTRVMFIQGLIGAAGSQQYIPDAVAMIDEAYRALFLRTRAAPAMDYGPFYSRNFVLCGDTVGRASVAESAAAAEASADIGTVNAGILSLQWSATCMGLPPGRRPVPEVHRPIALANPPVILNALGDPATPWVWAREMANMFRGASLITYDGVGHVVYGNTPSRCVNDAVTAYLLTLRRPGSIACPYVPS
ncbi:MAG: alpha/beta hydrolase [bacterium]